MKNLEHKNRVYTSFVLLLVLILILKSNIILAYVLLVLGPISFIEFSNLTKKIFKKKFNLYFFNLLFIIYVSIFCMMFFLFSSFLYLKILFFIFLSGCVASDIGGYVVGRKFKGPKLTKISPKKTVSGAVGSLIFTSTTVLSISVLFLNEINYKLFFISIVISLTCQIGDIFFSYLKRNARVKDTGNFFPGHGGVLDRIDGILLGVPSGFIILSFIY